MPRENLSLQLKVFKIKAAYYEYSEFSLMDIREITVHSCIEINNTPPYRNDERADVWGLIQ